MVDFDKAHEEGKKRKSRHQAHFTPPEKDESEVRWLISYSDFMMQLVCLFILLYSVATMDPVKVAPIVQAWREEMGIDPTVTGPAPGRVVPLTPADLPAALREMQVMLSRYPEGGQIRLSSTADGFRLQLVYEMFEDDAVALGPQGRRIADLAASILKPYQPRLGSIQVTGHSAAGEGGGDPDRAMGISLERARGVIGWITRPDLTQRVEGRGLVPAGRGAHDPVADGASPASRGLNRRVDFQCRLSGR